MDAFDTMFEACCMEAVDVLPLVEANNESLVESLCTHLTLDAIHSHKVMGVLDFEEVVPVLPAWWINGLIFVIILSTTALLNLLSIHIFLDSSMRSPTNVLLTAITAMDLLTCLFQAPINVYAYLMGNYRELPSYTWCNVYFYVHNYLPVSLHGSAFLLNMYLSVQRFVGVNGIRRFVCVGTYKGTIIAIISCLLISFAINSIYPAMIALEKVIAISKKVISIHGFDYIQSCSIVGHYEFDSKSLFSAYMWLRVLVIQIPPALVLSVCNIALIRASYSTHIYRKRLVGTVGAILDSRPGSVTDRSSISTLSNMVILCERRSSFVTRCPQQMIKTENTNKCSGLDVRERKAVHEFSKYHHWPHQRNGKVAPTDSHAVLTNVAHDRETTSDVMKRTGGIIQIEAPTTRSRDVYKPTYGDFQWTTSSAKVDRKCSENFAIKLFNMRETPFESGNGNLSAENNNSYPTHLAVGDIPQIINVEHSTYTRIDDVSLCDAIPEHVPVSMTSTNIGNICSLVESSRKASAVNNRDRLLTEKSLKLKGRNHASVRNNRQSDGGGSTRGEYQPYKLKIHRSHCEMRSTIMLVLVTSCTLLIEIFVIITLLFKYLKAISVHESDVLSYADLTRLMMACNTIMIVNFPVNFFCFCGLSQAFRSLLKVRLNALMRKIQLGR